jgi:aerobic-type carbon monoxide dehydrogenase small subunit (CoxS/CutS family)
MTEDCRLSAYVCPYCNQVFDQFKGLREHAISSHAGLSIPDPSGKITLSINGQMHKVHVEPEWTLYYLIHDRLGLTGTKQMCDRGVCGSCTVIMNGHSVLSCTVLAIECDGKRIQTIEGIATDGHPLVEEYVKHHAMQCGYCTPGFVVSAKGLLDKNPHPTVRDIRDELAGNLCRCGSYPQHTKAIVAAAEKMEGLKARN